MDRRRDVAAHYNIGAEVLLNQVRVQRVRCMWSLIGRTWERKHTKIVLILTIHKRQYCLYSEFTWILHFSPEPLGSDVSVSAQLSERAHLQEAFLVAGCQSLPCQRA